MLSRQRFPQQHRVLACESARSSSTKSRFTTAERWMRAKLREHAAWALARLAGRE